VIFEAAADWPDEPHLELDGVTFASSYRTDGTPTAFHICKGVAAIHDLLELLAAFERPNIVELGVFGGGSTALLSLAARPRKLVSMELSAEPLPALAGFIEERGLGDVVRPYFGVDQADRERVTEILAVEFGDEPLDLVIDDASHLLGPTRVSFELLFPRVRPGGLYLIEDWNWKEQLLSGAPAPDELLAQFEAAIAGSAELRAQMEEQVRATLADEDAPEHELYRRRLEEVAAGGLPTPATVSELLSTAEITEEYREGPQLISFIIELVLAHAHVTARRESAALDQVTLQPGWVAVRRGAAPLDWQNFRITDLYADVDGFLDGHLP
jgi:predicted O-methyltransferase YrrM